MVVIINGVLMAALREDQLACLHLHHTELQNKDGEMVDT